MFRYAQYDIFRNYLKGTRQNLDENNVSKGHWPRTQARLNGTQITQKYNNRQCKTKRQFR